MGNETKSNGASSLGQMEHYVYSGEKKHVLAGIGIYSPDHRSHQDYMEKADKARLSSSSSDSRLYMP